MSDYPDEIVQSDERVDGDMYRDLQNAALRECLELSDESVRPVKTALEQQHNDAKAKLEARFASASDKIETRFREKTAATEQHHAQQAKSIQDLYESDIKTLETNTRTARNGVTSKASGKIRRAAKERDDKTWMADTVASSAQEAIQIEHKKAHKSIVADRDKLESYRQHAVWLMERYERELGKPLPVEQADVEAEIPAEDPAGLFQRQCELIQQQLDDFEECTLPGWFVGAQPYVVAGGLCALAVGVMVGLHFVAIPHWPSLVITGPLAAVVVGTATVLVGKPLKRKAALLIDQFDEAFLACHAEALSLLEKRSQWVDFRKEADQQEVAQSKQQEVESAREAYDVIVATAERDRDGSLQEIDDAYQKLHHEIESRHDSGVSQVTGTQNSEAETLQQQHEKDLQTIRERYEHERDECEGRYNAERKAMEERWDQGIDRIQKLLDKTECLGRDVQRDWSDASWSNWTPSRDFVSTIPLGYWRIDVANLAPGVRERASFVTDDTTAIMTPALLKLPDRCSLFLQSDRAGRSQAIDALRATMLRILTSLPPGRVQFTIVDPVGLGENFAGFMHLADYEEALVGGRIWTGREHIEQRLAELTNRMENIIQKYLRNEFETIDAYNEQAGELAEPYRFLVIADFPVNCSDEACRRLSSIVNSGARCGLHTLIYHDTRQEMVPGIEVEDLQAGGVHIVYENDCFVWQDDLLRQFPLTIASPPDEDRLTQLMHAIGQGAKDALRVEVPFETIAPDASKTWSSDSSKDLVVPVGRKGAVRFQELQLGRGVAQHALIAGKTGSGKSTLLHVMITNLALWYSPDEVEFYLIDFKKGVEFKTYVTNRLPHARAIGIESDREFGLSVLQRLDAEMTRRGELFRQHDVQDLQAYRQVSNKRMPRTLLMVDEFQVFFSEDDRLAQDAAVLLDRLVRQGRAFGVHALLGSQTLGGTSGLARSTMGQMAVRIALQCSEADSQMIFDDTNMAARLLTRPGEAIYNDAGGLVEGNNPFQVSWLSDETRDTYLQCVAEIAAERGVQTEPTIVFEGNAPADVAKNLPLTNAIASASQSTATMAPQAWLGEPVAIKAPTSVTFRRQSGANLFMVGQRQDAAMAMMAASMAGLAAQHDADSARFVIMDGLAADDPQVGYLEKVAVALPHETRNVAWRDVADTMTDIANEVQQRLDNDQTDQPAIYVFILGLQRYRMLRRNEDDYGFSMDGSEQAPTPDKQLIEILREGPAHGVHVITWADTPASLDRALSRQSLGLFDNRVLFQISASDSSNLIDSPAANQLGFYRALLYSEEQGVAEKFRPFSVPDSDWLDHLRNAFTREP